MRNRPDWDSAENDSGWERVKSAFKNDWEQTKSDFGADGARDMDQDVDDTVKQALGTDDAFENREQAFRFGYGARRSLRTKYPEWNADLEARLRADYPGDYDADRGFIRYAYGREV